MAQEQMVREMRRKDREIDEIEARKILDGGEFGFLSLVDSAGEPYGVPISYVLRDNEIYFHSAPEGRKVDALCTSGRASFCVVGATEMQPEMFSTRYLSAIVSGEVRELLHEEKIEVLIWLVEKYAPQFLEQGREYIASRQAETRVFALRVRHISGKQRQ